MAICPPISEIFYKHKQLRADVLRNTSFCEICYLNTFSLIVTKIKDFMVAFTKLTLKLLYKSSVAD